MKFKIKKIVTLLTLSLSINVHAKETYIMALIDSPRGKALHNFESKSTHSFYIYNEDKVTHVYNWVMRQCIFYNGSPSKCPTYDSGKLTLSPGQVFQFGHFLTLNLFCEDKNFKLDLYAQSTLKRDDGKAWMDENYSVAICE